MERRRLLNQQAWRQTVIHSHAAKPMNVTICPRNHSQESDLTPSQWDCRDGLSKAFSLNVAEALEPEIKNLTNCQHILHRSCLDRWMGYDQ
ncbi:hypothetical protein L6164_033622 [Bauhinia variegata]|uniref:Uncharacterized protein n=1 Tax=Bauhinia variegata TaxID=167791 RepID=A0ACB9KT44_BAUVA|nr:hypothetical protein L6164_033622 [Bauhinia variegata]